MKTFKKKLFKKIREYTKGKNYKIKIECSEDEYSNDIKGLYNWLNRFFDNGGWFWAAEEKGDFTLFSETGEDPNARINAYYYEENNSLIIVVSYISYIYESGTYLDVTESAVITRK